MYTINTTIINPTTMQYSHGGDYWELLSLYETIGNSCDTKRILGTHEPQRDYWDYWVPNSLYETIGNSKRLLGTSLYEAIGNSKWLLGTRETQRDYRDSCKAEDCRLETRTYCMVLIRLLGLKESRYIKFFFAWWSMYHHAVWE